MKGRDCRGAILTAYRGPSISLPFTLKQTHTCRCYYTLAMCWSLSTSVALTNSSETLGWVILSWLWFMFWRVTGSVKVINNAPARSPLFCTINKSFANHYFVFFRVRVCFCGNVLRVIWYKNSYDSANVSLGECDCGAHDARGQWPGLGQGGK